MVVSTGFSNAADLVEVQFSVRDSQGKALAVRTHTLVAAFAAIACATTSCRHDEPPQTESSAAKSPSTAAPLAAGVAAVNDDSLVDTTHRPPGTHGHAIDVVLVVGAARIPIGGDAEFSDSAARLLPAPGEIRVTDAHAAAHGDKSHCWSFRGGILRLDETIFGLAEVALLTTAPKGATCPSIPEGPRVEVGSFALSLNTRASDITEASMRGFKIDSVNAGKELTRQWWYAERRKDRRIVCVMEYIQVSAAARGDTLTRLEIWKSAEAWRAKRIAKPAFPADSVWTCWSS